MKETRQNNPKGLLLEWPDSGTAVIFDLEYTAWEGSWERSWSEDWEYREIVQIGAVKVDILREFQVIQRFSALVLPSLNPRLSTYFMGLTGISQSDVDLYGLPFAKAAKKFLNFIGRPDYIYCNGTDGEVWLENYALAGIRPPVVAGHCINLRLSLAEAISSLLGKEFSFVDSGDLADLLGIQMSNIGKKHDALYDAEGIAQALQFLRQNKII